MNSDEFETQARLYVLGALDDDELTEFEAQRRALGPAAERVIQECERLNSIVLRSASARLLPRRPPGNGCWT